MISNAASQSRSRTWAPSLLLLVLFLAPRLPNLRSFVTLDEPFWLSVGANFYYALGQRELQNTVYEYHPAVSTMWFVTGAMLAYFPEYRGLGQGYFDVDKNKFDPFLLAHGISPLTLLYDARLFQLLVLAGLVLVFFGLLRRIAGPPAAFLATAYITASPFFLGHSLVLNHEALLALCVLISVAGLIVYLDHGRRLLFLVLSGGAAAVAQLTKSSAIAMMPVIGLVLAASVLRQARTSGLRKTLFDHLMVLGAWLLALVVVYVAFWPGMWVAPGKMLYEVYGNAFSYAFQGARLQVTQQLQPSEFGLAAIGPTAAGFLRDLVWRSTPATWIGLLLAGASLALPPAHSRTGIRPLMGYMLATAAAFVLMFSVAQGRNSPHYIMTTHIGLDAIAALGWGMWGGRLLERTAWHRASAVGAAGIAALLAVQLGSALTYSPYFFTYFNPITAFVARGSIGYHYGEGLEQAAAYLAAKPDASSLSVLAYPARGPFSYYYPGETLILNPLYLEDPGMPSMFERLDQADYLVFYDALADRTANSARFVRALEDRQPEHLISVQGIEAILIYRVPDIAPALRARLAD